MEQTSLKKREDNEHVWSEEINRNQEDGNNP